MAIHAMVLQDQWGGILCPPTLESPLPLVWGSASVYAGFSEPVTPLYLHPLMLGSGICCHRTNEFLLCADIPLMSSSYVLPSH